MPVDQSESLAAALNAVGRTVRAVSQEIQDHTLDDSDQDGTITIEFVDGSKLHVEGVWCNDSTASTDARWEPGG